MVPVKLPKTKIARLVHKTASAPQAKLATMAFARPQVIAVVTVPANETKAKIAEPAPKTVNAAQDVLASTAVVSSLVAMAPVNEIKAKIVAPAIVTASVTQDVSAKATAVSFLVEVMAEPVSKVLDKRMAVAAPQVTPSLLPPYSSSFR